MNNIFFAKLLSYIFNPLVFFLLMPYLMVHRQTNDDLAALRWGIFSAAFVIVGLMIVVVGRIRGVFSDFDLSNRKERAKFYLLLWPLLICYVAASVFFRGMFFSLSIIAIGIVIGLLLFEFINQKVKASIHVGVAVAFVIALGVLYGWDKFFIAALFVPLLAWSRLVLKKHTLKEVFTGGGLGIIITGVTIFIAKILL